MEGKEEGREEGRREGRAEAAEEWGRVRGGEDEEEEQGFAAAAASVGKVPVIPAIKAREPLPVLPSTPLGHVTLGYPVKTYTLQGYLACRGFRRGEGAGRGGRGRGGGFCCLCWQGTCNILIYLHTVCSVVWKGRQLMGEGGSW